MERIRELEQLQGAELNAVKVLLADEATRMLHGEECLSVIHATVQSLFAAGGGSGSGAVSGDSLDSLEKIALKTSDFAAAGVGETISVVELLVKVGFAASKNEARRMIRQNAVKVNDEKVVEESAVIQKQQFDSLGGKLKLSNGKKKHVLVVLP